MQLRKGGIVFGTFSRAEDKALPATKI